jgi:hypothetical protein
MCGLERAGELNDVPSSSARRSFRRRRTSSTTRRASTAPAPSWAASGVASPAACGSHFSQDQAAAPSSSSAAATTRSRGLWSVAACRMRPRANEATPSGGPLTPSVPASASETDTGTAGTVA